MTLQNPQVVYTAASNTEAYLLRLALEQAGVDAFVMEDTSGTGFWALGLISQIHRPKVCVEATAVEAARQIILDFEAWNQERLQQSAEGSDTREAVDVTCKDCGHSSSFPAHLMGTVQNCPHCKAYVDCEPPEAANEDPYWETAADEPNDSDERK